MVRTIALFSVDLGKKVFNQYWDPKPTSNPSTPRSEKSLGSVNRGLRDLQASARGVQALPILHEMWPRRCGGVVCIVSSTVVAHTAKAGPHHDIDSLKCIKLSKGEGLRCKLPNGRFKIRGKLSTVHRNSAENVN